ncbi:MAG TPA: protease pro-enzyme activation domain-containing protein [Acidobacteriaceae bacterium]|nr:protease pro-enzyme activation domain-containing protein [Acidobacteriaceae bacterium]
MLLWLCAAPLAAQSLPGLSAPPATRQINEPVQEDNLTAVPSNLRALASNELDQGRVPDSLPQHHILMLLRRSEERERALARFIDAQYDPRSPLFHKWLTPSEYGEFFGPSPEDIETVEQWLEGHGFTINRVSEGRTFIDFDGTAGQIASAFHTEIHRYRRDGEDHFSNTQDPQIPAALVPLVSGFRALNNFHPKPQMHTPQVVHFDRSSGKWSHLTQGNLTSGSGGDASYLVTPQDFAQIYGLKQVWQQEVAAPGGRQKLVGTGQTIGIVGDSDLNSQDIQSFRDQFGITALGPNGSVVVNHPPTPVCTAPPVSGPGSNDPEGYLDVEWSGATAPDATIDFVVCGNEGVTSGADLAAAYIIQDPVQSQSVGVLSTSFGYCEKTPISETAQFYVDLWRQAAVEGITVVVAAGDAGSAECDEFSNNVYAVQGAWVDADASTPYNVAVGGTDFSDVFSGSVSRYWTANNGTAFQSAKSYIPETTWNESCADPLVLDAFGQGYRESAGPDGFCTYASKQPIDPYLGFAPRFFVDFAGSGGLSTISSRPDWQVGVYGIPSGWARAVPDISLFASSGSAWGHALLLCDSLFLPPGQSCDFSSSSDVYAEANGGTSFSAPAFAGIMALIEQKSAGRQGQANYVLYPLAGEQYVNLRDPRQPSLASCASYLGADSLNTCYFHDISGTPNPDPATRAQTPFFVGTNAVPCTGSATSAGVYTDASSDPASNWEDCYGYQITVNQNAGSLIPTPDYFGVLSTADNDHSPAFSAAPGYDLATGLGSPNVAALVNAPEWITGGRRPTVEVRARRPTNTSRSRVILDARVFAQPGDEPAQAGSVTFFSAGAPLGTMPLRCGGDGQVSLTVPGDAFGAPGIYNDVYAYFSGGTAQCSRRRARAPYFYGAASAPVAIEVLPPRR